MPAKTTKATAERGYGGRHQRIRAHAAELVEDGQGWCVRCGGWINPAEPWDLGHADGDRSQHHGPEHSFCNRSAGGVAAHPPRFLPEQEPERAGLGQRDERWDVAWLKGLRRVPKDATWPRLMSVPHRRAVGSLGPQFIRWAERRSGFRLRWWQRLVATRLLEVDAQGELVWETLALSLARQLGKSWLLRELILWRIHQGRRFGEPQDVMHTGKDIAICGEVQRPARLWAKLQPDRYKVLELLGRQQIELLEDGSRWMVRAKDATYGYSVSLAVVDEAWKVPPRSIDEGLSPTMVERAQPQLLLVSTAHRLTTPLMLERRLLGLEQLEDGDGVLLVEWSAPPELRLDDRQGWRLASPHWTAKRERLIAAKLDGVRAGEQLADPDESDPEQSFQAQWLNRWPRRAPVAGPGDPLLPANAWRELVEPGFWQAPLHVALEDGNGNGAAVAVAARLPDGRVELDGWLSTNWEAAVADARQLAAGRQVGSTQVGASMLRTLPQGLPARPAGARETREGLPLVRDLVAGRRLVHDDDTGELDRALTVARVRESVGGLQLVYMSDSSHLVKAAVWATQSANRPVASPAVF
jgi:hypothetical protein